MYYIDYKLFTQENKKYILRNMVEFVFCFIIVSKRKVFHNVE